MSFSTRSLAVLGGYAALSSAHMLMATPAPFSSPALHNGPIQASGVDFPCQSTGGQYVGTASQMALGSDQPLSFTGSAVHGGGSCQVSITYDTAPTKSSIWRAITDIEGGCPAQGQTGNMGDNAAAADPYKYNFTIPADIPAGKVTLAWTWLNKIGNREFYMNCAPVELTGSGGPSSNFDKLPLMFEANIGNGCGTVDSKDVIFPNPAPVVYSMNGASSAFAAPTGNCAAAAPAGGSSGGSSGASSAAASAPVATAAPAASSSIPGGGGVFVTATSQPAAAPPATTVAATQAPAATTSAAAAPATSAASSGSGSSSGSSSGTVSGAQTAGSTCTDEGQWNCVGGSQYQRCASGTWSVLMPLAAGTKCDGGVSDNINIVASASRKFKGRRARSLAQ